MDASEAAVEQLLKQMGFESIVFEPDGQATPDFLVDGRIAVEVRRLNQNHDSGDGVRGLEEESIPLWHRVEKLAHSLGPPGGESWFLHIRFGRPLRPWNGLKTDLRLALKDFMDRPDRQDGTIYDDDHFRLDVTRVSQPLEHYFRMGSIRDRQSGGFIVAEILRNIAHCAAEKLGKMAAVRSKYQTWWLALDDHIGLDLLDDHDKQQLLDEATRPAGWDKIVVVSHRDPTRWIEF